MFYRDLRDAENCNLAALRASRRFAFLFFRMSFFFCKSPARLAAQYAAFSSEEAFTAAFFVSPRFVGFARCCAHRGPRLDIKFTVSLSCDCCCCWLKVDIKLQCWCTLRDLPGLRGRSDAPCFQQNDLQENESLHDVETL